jgi:hypothetical protein
MFICIRISIAMCSAVAKKFSPCAITDDLTRKNALKQACAVSGRFVRHRREIGALKHDPEKPALAKAGVDTGFPKRSCSNKELERYGDSS